MPVWTQGVLKAGLRAAVAWGAVATLIATSAGVAAADSGGQHQGSGSSLSGTLYFTRFATANYPGANFGGSGNPSNVGEISYTYANGVFSVSTPQYVAAVPAADGIAWTPGPKPQLVVGGQWTNPSNPGDTPTLSSADVYVVDPNTGQYTSVPAGTPAAFMLGLSPDGRTAYVGSAGTGAQGQLGVLSLYPTVAPAGTITLHGPDTSIDAIAFAGNTAFYTSSYPNAPGDFGTINLTTGQETRLLTDQPWAHGMVYDPYSHTLIASGMDEVAQINPKTKQVIGTQTIPLDQADANGQALFTAFDQPWVDGQGHVFVSANNGQLAFIDYAASGLLADPTYMNTVYVASWLDDVVGAAPSLSCTPRDPDQNGDLHSNNHNGKGEDNGHANNDQNNGVGQCGDPDSNGDVHSNNHNGQGEDNGHANNDQNGGVGQSGSGKGNGYGSGNGNGNMNGNGYGSGNGNGNSSGQW